MIVVDSLIIIGFLIYCFWYACKYHPDGVKMVLLCMAPILGACLIPLTCEHGSKEELISICVMMGLQVVWIPLLILIADQDQKSGNRDKRINKLCEDAVSNWQEQLAGLGYEHPRDVVSLLLVAFQQLSLCFLRFQLLSNFTIAHNLYLFVIYDAKVRKIFLISKFLNIF